MVIITRLMTMAQTNQFERRLSNMAKDDYVLDYAVGRFVLWQKSARYEVDVSEECALKWSRNNNCTVTEDASGIIESLSEDADELNEVFNGWTFDGLGL